MIADNTVLALMWCILELNLSIIGGSMPAMKPVMQKYFPRLLASTHGQTDSNAYYLDDSRSKPKRSRMTDPYNGSMMLSRDVDNKSESDHSDRNIVAFDVSTKSDGGVMGASLTKGGEQITKTIEYGYEVSGDEANPLPSASHKDEEAQMVRGHTPPRL